MPTDLSALLARRLGIPPNEADRALAQWAGQLKAAAREHGQVEMPGLGTFSFSADGAFAFQADDELNKLINADLGGLEPIAVNPSDPEHPYGEDDGFVFEEMQVPLATDTPKPRMDTSLTEDYWAPPDDEEMFAPLGPTPPSSFEEADFQVVRGDEERFFGLAEPPEEPAAEEASLFDDAEAFPPAGEVADIEPVAEAPSVEAAPTADPPVASAPPWAEAEVMPSQPTEPPSEFAPPSEAVESFEDALAELEATLQATAPTDAEAETLPTEGVPADPPEPEEAPPADAVVPPPPTLKVPQGFQADRRAARRRYEPEPEPDRRRFILLGGGVLAVLLIALLAWWFTRPAPPPPVAQTVPVAPADTSVTLAATDTLTTAAADSIGGLPEAPASQAPPVPVGANPALYGTVPIQKGGYGIIVGSAESAGQAERLARPFVALGYRTGVVFGTHMGFTRYRAVVGQFATDGEASQALRSEIDKLPEGAWVMRVGTRMDLTNLSL
ncbi:MAG: SPOR domain-containing protein [Bacteroidota bacterium]